jgi:hypothetical protein
MVILLITVIRFFIRDLCKTPPFAQFLCQAQILILKILNVFLWLKFSPSLNLNKIEHFSKVSIHFTRLPKMVMFDKSPGAMINHRSELRVGLSSISDSPGLQKSPLVVPESTSIF